MLAAQGLTRELNEVMRDEAHAEDGIDLPATQGVAGSAPLDCGLGGPGFTSTGHIRQLPAMLRRSW